jgi:hypothetical protein
MPNGMCATDRVVGAELQESHRHLQRPDVRLGYFGVDSRPGVLAIGAEPIEDSQPWSVHRINKSGFGYITLPYLAISRGAGGDSRSFAASFPQHSHSSDCAPR